jgi:hypothetical protein
MNRYSRRAEQAADRGSREPSGVCGSRAPIHAADEPSEQRIADVARGPSAQQIVERHAGVRTGAAVRPVRTQFSSLLLPLLGASFVLMSRLRSLRICSWNVRGLGDKDKCTDVKTNLFGCALNVRRMPSGDQASLLCRSSRPAGSSPWLLLLRRPGGASGILTSWNPADVLRLESSSEGEFVLPIH